MTEWAILNLDRLLVAIYLGAAVLAVVGTLSYERWKGGKHGDHLDR